MRKRRIGSLEVTVVGVGCNNFGRQLDFERTRSVIHAALDNGINFLDTADQYGRPYTSSESFIGEVLAAIGPRRQDLVIATKFGRILDDNKRGASPAYVRAATEACLRRLRVDCIDLMQLHIPDPLTPIEDTLGALGELIREGKIREIGASNFSGRLLGEAQAAAVRAGTPRFVSTQAAYSILNRAAEPDVLAECERSGIALVPFQPLYNGLLSGKYKAGQPAPANSRIGSKDPKAQAIIFSERNLRIVGELTDYAQRRGRTLLELAYGWLLSHPAIPSIIAGVSSPEQVASNAASTGWALSAAEITDIDRIAPATFDQIYLST